MPELTCIGCPQGCRITVEKAGPEVKVTGHDCLRGKKYALEETTAPKRTVTSVVAIRGSKTMFPVKTALPIPKEMVFTVMEEIRKITIEAPVRIGDVIQENIAGTGIALVATGHMTRE